MKAAERAERDAKALELFLGGANYRAIAATLSMTVSSAERIVKAELAAAAQRRLVLTDEALAIHLERYERLYQQQWLKASEKNDQRAAELCERMLARQARMFGLGDQFGPSPLPAPTPTTSPVAGEEAEDQDEAGPQDELAKLRAARSGA